MEQSPTPVRGSQRDRIPQEIFPFDKNHGYYVSRSTNKAILTCVLTMGGLVYYQYHHGMVLNTDGTAKAIAQH